ncbi:LuxR C-terminal-related transcriptional regulator [Marinobacter nanhaiticus D15-8W]|uniref:Helix-turn-helix transcriptional regulator n=1 Tax=Marinobacter nanhaiticus D15-8W TaxID=626887 RepID=N6WTA9_9GAMM|nr:LuxR C-terminal-related transcriptional regulator [Marinobacter nanhaiticus]ENO14247.1 helix-turn-helix transcriptional regulator [Marinobacter nanhaiticus D15-8W]BES71634.1 LuxR C-terminal-related transcriptional regulator [Marinobacter nanhaiticus D15-8W]
MLLTTKFLRPAADPRAIPRNRLLQVLERREGKRLNLVVGPAGFGKTTLVNQWSATQTLPVAWLSLDANDDDPRRFWQYITGALVHAGFAELEKCQQAFNTYAAHELEGAITGLINGLVENVGGGMNLVIDDYHQIQAAEIHRQMTYFLDYLPPGVTVVLVSRTEPDLPIARWRVRQWVDDIHPQLLAFSEDECHRFFQDCMAIRLSKDEARRIWQKTEGWVAAMQLSALSARNRPSLGDVQSANLIPDSSRQINDYILSEVLDQQPENVADFLLDTACCLRLTASLCDRVRESRDSQEMLEALSQRNLFLIPLDNRDEWFRYHDLFREALFQRLQQTDPDRIQTLQSRAIRWLLEHDHIQEAIAQLVQLEDWPWLAGVLEQHGNNLIHGGFHLPVLDWLDKLPSGTVESNPRLSMLQIWGHFFANRLDALEPRLERLEDLLDRRVADSHPDAEGALGLHSEIALIRSYLARTRSDLKSASDLTQQVLRDIDHTQIPLKSVTYYGLGLDYFGRGDLPAAEEALQSAVSHGQIERKPSTVLSSGGLLAWIQFNRGHIDLALESCISIRQWIDRHYTDPKQPKLLSCWQNCALIEIYRERGELELADTYLAPLLGHLEQGTEPGQHVIIQYARAHLAFTRGDYEQATRALDDAERVLRGRREHIVFEPPNLAALKARVHLAKGELELAREWLEHRNPEEFRNPLNAEQDAITAARVMIALDKPGKAITLLTPLRLSTETGQHNKHLIEVLTVYAEALDREGKTSDAMPLLVEALKRSSSEQIYRLFIEESAVVHALIRDTTSPSVDSRYLQKLREMLPETKVRDSAPKAGAKTLADLIEPLSARESEVLELINEGLANKDIALRMQVAGTTVKAHIRNLYGKLQVKSRTEALARARQLDLLK